MPILEIPNVDEFARHGLVRRFFDERLDAELLYALLALIAMTAIAVGFGDPLTPFYSFTFIFGIAAIFFFAITFSTSLGLIVAAGLLALMFFTSWNAGHAELVIFAFEAPFLAAFFAGLAILPNLMPTMLETEVAHAETENHEMESKVAELESQLASFQKEVRVDRMDKQKRETVKLSTRSAVLNGYVRELLQSSSPREILNVLFHNMTRVFGVQECAMLVYNRNTQELVVTRIVHPQQADLENKKLDPNLPLFRMAFDRREPLVFDRPETIEETLAASLMIPILVDGEIYAIFTVARTKTGDLEPDEAQFILGLASMASGAVDQLKMVLAG